MHARHIFVLVLEALWFVTAGASAAPAQRLPASTQSEAVVAKISSQLVPTKAHAPATFAKEAPHKPLGPQEAKRKLQQAVAQLNDDEPATIQQALMELRELAGGEAALAISKRLSRGLPPQLAEAAIDVLGSLNQPVATAVLVELTLHRRWQIRERALSALGTFKVRSVVSALLYALDDPSAEVRSAAALALGRLGDPRALPALSAAVERGVGGAMLALAQLGNARHVALILKHARLDLKGSEPSLRTLLTRPNLHVSSKISVVKAVQETALPEAQSMLASWRADFAKGFDSRLVAALQAQGQKP